MDASDYRTVALAEGEVNSVEVGEGVPDAPPREPEPCPSPSERALAEIAAVERSVSGAKDAWEYAKLGASDAKKVYEGEVDRMRAVIRRLTVAEKPLPLFDRGDAIGEDAEEPADWRDVPLSSLPGLGDGILSALAKHTVPILTLGHLADHTSAYPLTDIAGIGEAKAYAIDAATEAFWAARQDDGIPEDVRHLAPAEGPARAEAPEA